MMLRNLALISHMAKRGIPVLALAMSLFCSGRLVAEELRREAPEEPSLSIALTGKFPPFSYYDEDGYIAGFDVDVSRAVAKRMGRHAEIVTTEWDGILAGLLAGQYDTIIGSMAITEEREKVVNFSRPYYISGAQLFIHQKNLKTISGLDDCAGRKIGTVLGETYEHFLRQNYPEVDVVSYKGTPDIFQDLENHRIAGFITDTLVGAWQIRQAAKPFIPAGELLYEERIAIPVRKDRRVLLDRINQALEDLETDGELRRIHDWYFSIKRTEQTSPQTMSAVAMARLLARGFATTLGVAVTSLLMGFLLAVPCGVFLHRGQGVRHRILRSAIDFIRGTPVLIQLLFVYYGAPHLGAALFSRPALRGLFMLTPLTAAVVTLSINSASYMSEVIRSGLMSVDAGQILAGRALGLSRQQIFFLIIWPQAFRIAIPPLVNSMVALTKDTALIMVVSVREVVSAAQSIISVTFDPITFYFIVGVLFFVVTFPLMKLAGRLEERIKKRGFSA